MKPFYLTTPIYYVNDLPHIGHIYTTVVADVLARYRRLLGDDVRLLTGTDEHGVNIERAAARQGVAPIELADRVAARYREVWRELGVTYDDFIRTTEPRHRRGVEALIARLDAASDLYTARHEGWYCAACETFYTEKELRPGQLCPVHESPAEWRAEENVFFRLSRYQDRLLEWYERESPVWPPTRANEVRSFVAAGLRDLSVSRANLAWGIPFPGRPGQTIYVWLDALANYVTALGFGGEEVAATLYRRYWETSPARVHLIGKDIIRHHAVYWPAFLLSAGLPLPSRVVAHGWWLRDERKVSKSTGNVVRPDYLIKDFGADALRYFLLREMVFGQDASFSDEAFVDRFNSDLANDLGNTVSRVVTLARQAFAGRTPPTPCDDNPIARAAGPAVAEYRAAMEEWAFGRALEALWRLLAETNQYLVAREPWKLIKSEGPSEKLSRVLWNGLEGARIVSSGLLPFMPTTAPGVLRALGVNQPPASLDALEWGGTPTGVELPEPAPLFPRIDRAAYLAKLGSAAPAAPPAAAEKGGAMITIDRFFETELRVGTVTAAESVPKSSKLLKLTIDLGEEAPRTLVAGIAQQYAPEALVGKQVVVVANLQPAKLMGVESQGMVLAASENGAAVLLHPEKPVPAGTRVK
jgi:methionyl-tRNA synthetase